MAAGAEEGEGWYLNIFALGVLCLLASLLLWICVTKALSALFILYKWIRVLGGGGRQRRRARETFFFTVPQAATKPPSTPPQNAYITCPVTVTHVYVYSPG